MPVVVLTAILSAVLSGIYLHVARRRHIVDLPNERSSHTRATPSGGGVALLLALANAAGILLAAMATFLWRGMRPRRTATGTGAHGGSIRTSATRRPDGHCEPRRGDGQRPCAADERQRGVSAAARLDEVSPCPAGRPWEKC